MGARILKNYDPSISSWSGQGQAQVNDYGMLGAYGYLIELWGSPAFDADINDDGRVSADETMMWIDTELHGEGWVTPHTFNHPDLGEIWIGGTQKKAHPADPAGQVHRDGGPEERRLRHVLSPASSQRSRSTRSRSRRKPGISIGWT